MNKLHFTKHALEQMEERGAGRHEVEEAIRDGEKIPAKKGRHAYRMNFQYDRIWAGKKYSIKQVMPIVKEDQMGKVVITVYTFYF